jgi:hypothetical protein
VSEILVGRQVVSLEAWQEHLVVQVRGPSLVLLYQSWGLRRELLLALYWGDLLPVLRQEPLREHRLMGSCLTGINVTTVNTHLIDYITFVFPSHRKTLLGYFHLFTLLRLVIDLYCRSVM